MLASVTDLHVFYTITQCGRESLSPKPHLSSSMQSSLYIFSEQNANLDYGGHKRRSGRSDRGNKAIGKKSNDAVAVIETGGFFHEDALIANLREMPADDVWYAERRSLPFNFSGRLGSDDSWTSGKGNG